LRLILRGLLAALGGFGLEAMRGLILYRRISAISGRIERMLVRFRAGRLWRISQRKARVGAFACGERTLPRRFGWLVQAGGHRAAAFGSQLQAVLNTEEMSALLAASPQAGRLLRPLCRALAVALPASSAAPRPTATRRWAAPIRRPEPEKFRIPLPRGVLAAARREGFGKQD
jgi:hypothetical protein